MHPLNILYNTPSQSQRLRTLHWNIDAAPYRNIVRKYEKLSRWHRVGLIGKACIN